MTQAQLAERLGVSQSQVARVEKKGYEAYTLTTLRRYAAALGQDCALEVKLCHPRRHEGTTEPVGTP